MRLLGVFGELRSLRREFRELTTQSVAEEEKAKYELTASARKFAHGAKAVVDDKMSFSATLMRAGEVDAANRLLEEVEEDVRVEEAALIEKMNEVKIARANKRERITRVRLARLMAVSLAGSMLMGASALGMAAAGFMQERETDQIRQNAVAMRRAAQAARAASGQAGGKLQKLKGLGLDKKSRRILLAEIENGNLTPAQAADIRTLVASGDIPGVEDIVYDVLPSGVARDIVERIADAVSPVVVAAPEAIEKADAATVLPKVRKKIKKATEEPADSEEPEPSPSPEETEAPPEETEEKGDKNETEGNNNNEGEASGPGDEDPVLGDGEGLEDRL